MDGAGCNHRSGRSRDRGHAGITRARVLALLRGAGVTVVEKTLSYEDFLSADEVFTAGNFAKVAPVTGLDDVRFEPGPVFRRARQLYWDFAHGRLS